MLLLLPELKLRERCLFCFCLPLISVSPESTASLEIIDKYSISDSGLFAYRYVLLIKEERRHLTIPA